MSKQSLDLYDTKRLNVLVTCGGGFQGLSIIKGLRHSHAVRIIMADSSPENIGKYFVDKFYTVPPITNSRLFLRSLCDICDKESIDLIIPSTNIELPELAKHRSLFSEKGISVAVSDSDFLRIVLNKYSLYEFIAEKGLPVLPLLDISDPSLDFPVIGKPLNSWGGQGILIIRSRREMRKYNLRELQTRFAWQRCLENFEEFSIDCAIDSKGRISELSIRRRIKTIGGFAAIAESVEDDNVHQISTDFFRLILELGAQGIFNIQILKEAGSYFLSDVNPRSGTSSVFSNEIGTNLPLFLCDALYSNLYSGKKIKEPPHSKDVSMVRYLDEFWIWHQKGIRGIVFDLDDTLLDQKSWIFGKLAMLWEEFAEFLPERNRFLQLAIQTLEEGNRSHLFDALARQLGWNNELVANLISAYRSIIPQGHFLFPDVIPVLELLKKSGNKLVLLTDNPPESQKQKIEAHRLDHLFDDIIYSREMNCEKPDRSLFLEASKRIGEKPDALAIVGDHLYKDILGGLESGFGVGFWLAREGTFFNFDQNLFERLTGLRRRFAKIKNLQLLLWSLNGGRNPLEV